MQGGRGEEDKIKEQGGRGEEAKIKEQECSQEEELKAEESKEGSKEQKPNQEEESKEEEPGEGQVQVLGMEQLNVEHSALRRSKIRITLLFGRPQAGTGLSCSPLNSTLILYLVLLILNGRVFSVGRLKAARDG